MPKIPFYGPPLWRACVTPAKLCFHAGSREWLGVRDEAALWLTEDAASPHGQHEQEMRWQLSGRKKARAQKFRKKEKDNADAVNYICILFKVWEMAAARESGRGCDRFVTESVTREGQLDLTFLLSWLCCRRSCKLGMCSKAGQVRVAAQLNIAEPFIVPW